MSTTSGGDTEYMQENSVNSVTTLYNGDHTVVNHRVTPPSSSNADSGLDNSYPESSAGDAKLIIDVPDFSKEMETPRTGIDNPSFETDKTDVPKPITNGHNGTVNHEKDKMAEAVNLELINMKPFAKSINGKENGVPKKKKETAVNMNDTYDDYFIPVNEHKKYIRGGEKLYVTKDKRDMNQSKKPFICWVFGLVLLAAAVIIAILASTGVIFNNETAVESRNFMENEKIAGFGNHHGHFSSVSPPPSIDSSSPFNPPTTDMSGVYLPRTVQGEIVIDNLVFTPGLANKSSTEFITLASSIETELKNALFKNQPSNSVADDIHIKVLEFSSGSVVAKYRIGWEYKDDSEPQDLIDAVTLKTRLDSFIRESNGFLYNYKVPIHRLRSDPVMDKCKINNGKCSHYCSYDYKSLDFVCSCPSELTISENMKDCKRISKDINNDDIDDINVHDDKHDEDSFDTKSDYDSFSELEPSSVPESKSEVESELKPEPEPSSEPEGKVEPEPNTVPEVEPEPNPSSESEGKAEPEPNTVPKVEPEPKPSSESEGKAEPEPNTVPEVEPEPKPSSESDIVGELVPSTESEVKAEPTPSSVLEVKPESEPISESEVKAEPEPNSVSEVKAEPEPNTVPEVEPEPKPNTESEIVAELMPSTESEVKAELMPSSVPEVKPEPTSESEVKAEPEPNSVSEVKAEPEPSSKSEPEPSPKSEPEPSPKSEPEPSLISEVKAEPEPSSEPEVKVGPEPSPKPIVKVESEIGTKIEPDSKPEPVPSAESDSKSSIDNYETLSDVDISSESDTVEQNNNPSSSSSSEKPILNIDQSDREAKSHSDEVFSHEIKPEVTYSVSTETEFETKTELAFKDNSKPKESSELLGDIDLNDPEESTVIPSITENWLTTTLSSIPSIPKLPSDLEVTEKENGSTEEKVKTEALGFEQMELKSENKSTIIDLMSESHSKSPIEEIITEIPETTISGNVKDLLGVVTVSTIDVSSTIKEDMNLPMKELENISNEHVTEYIYMTTMPSTIDQELVMPLHSSENPNSLEKNNSNDLTNLEKTNIPDPTKKLQSLTSLEDQVTNSPHIEVLSTSTQSNMDNFNENSSPDEQDTILTHSNESNLSDVVNENDNMSALDLYQKPESKKKDKKTSKNPEFYLSDSGFTKRNKIKTEKENKKNNKSDAMDMMTELLNSNKCEEGQFQCINGTTKDGSYCIKMSSRCDTNKDCTDNSDEYDCAENSCAGNFLCKSGECLQRNLVCNNIMECEDGSDEQSCDLWKCANDEKQCTGGQCLPEAYFCDGKSDCNDHSDELQCNSTCNGYQCSNSYCISSTLRCNGVNDCSGGEDEQNCECSSNEFKCNTGSECIPKTQICDNVPQCTDQSDEWQCVQLDGVQLFAKKESEIAMKVCSNDWSETWSNFVCQSLGFTETKTTNFRSNENSTENLVGYLKLKQNSTLNSSKSLTGYLEPALTSCETVEIKCSSKHLCGDFGGKDPLSMEMWPSVVYLHNTLTHKSCTSSLVKRNWILSSYSCVHSIDESLSPEQWEVISSKSRVANEQNLTKRSVSRIISHPGVKFEKLRYFNDSVLVELSTPYDLSEEVNTICLPEKVVDNKQPCVTASWSYESPGVFKQFSRSLSEPLMQTDLCNSTKHFNGFLTEQEICVASGEMEASNMEIGSPLMCLAENGLWQVQGMLSYRGGYGRSSKPSLYNAIVESVPWIENTIAFGV
ncbi:uncharacterized protein LOC112600867 [Melanaphis sacchari]|uniref:uncharacterized protein LOC112600867 n=1 Tax=Melanaphis sacchari TaxID=742174 RepID=UPI000DC14F5E|nr:uncharacterized protein LOC112600867 [Melanaphis sacchari]